jgi:hypothetical protein
MVIKVCSLPFTDPSDLINLASAREQGVLLHQFRKDAAYRPDVYRCGILFCTKQ